MKTLETLIPKLLEKTSEGTLAWTEGTSHNGYHTTIGEHLIAIWAWSNEEEGTAGYSIGIKRLLSNSYSDTMAFDTYAPRYDRILELHQAARRSALKIDRMIEAVEEELDELTRF